MNPCLFFLPQLLKYDLSLLLRAAVHGVQLIHNSIYDMLVWILPRTERSEGFLSIISAIVDRAYRVHHHILRRNVFRHLITRVYA